MFENIVQPDLILLDLGLPDGSGLDVLRTIRSVPELRTAPVVVLSCSDDETVMQQCMEAGANAFVVKSANYDDFQALLGPRRPVLGRRLLGKKTQFQPMQRRLADGAV